MFNGHTYHILQEEESILNTYQITLFLTIMACLLGAIVNYSQELHMFTIQEMCERSEIQTDITNFFGFYVLPLVIIVIITLAFDTKFWRLPYLNHINLQGLYMFIFNQVSIKSSMITVLLLLAPMPSLLRGLGIIDISNNLELLLGGTLFLPFLCVKSPLLLRWHLYTERQNLQAAQNALEAIERQPMPNSPNTVMETDL